ncbi:MAG: HEAT repeat domain-containing protein [Phaeodactylibacter sp.]|nr:HEAT repeat domain-containing protein [Phaeodactylibacter sp.]
MLAVLAQAVFPQDQQARIDSLVNLLKSAGREWNDYANPLIEIGEPAVPALIKAAEDRSLKQWNRRVAIMTLNNIHSPQWVKPALDILFDQNEDPVLRNQATAGLKGHDLSNVKQELWELYKEGAPEIPKLNIAALLLTADTAMAYRAFKKQYYIEDGYGQKMALLNLVRLRPEASTRWFLDGLQVDDWMAANLAMDSLVASRYFVADELTALYHQPGIREEVQWRVVYVFGHRQESASVPLLLEAFREESWLVHTEAAVGLCRFTPEEVIPEVEKLKDDARPYVRNNARWVLGRMEDWE